MRFYFHSLMFAGMTAIGDCHRSGGLKGRGKKSRAFNAGVLGTSLQNGADFEISGGLRKASGNTGISTQQQAAFHRHLEQQEYNDIIEIGQQLRGDDQ